MKYIISSALGAIKVSLAFVNTPSAHAFATSTRVPISFSEFVTFCGTNGQGEIVTFSGTDHINVGTTLDNSGGLHFIVEENPQGISGVGQTTGDRYQATGAFVRTFNIKVGTEGPIDFSNVFNHLFIGQGSGNNFQFRYTIHFTIFPDGTLTANVVNVNVVCR